MTRSTCLVGKVGAALLVAIFVATSGCAHHRRSRATAVIVVPAPPRVDVGVHIQ